MVPFLYYVLYTFLLRQFLIDATRSRDKPRRQAVVHALYVAGSVTLYGLLLLGARPVG